MPLVNVLVNGRAYTLACDAGEEEHLRELGRYLDKRVSELQGSVGAVGDARLLLMAGLVVADELSDALARLSEREREVATLKSSLTNAQADAQNTETRAIDTLESAASRVEAIAARLARP